MQTKQKFLSFNLGSRDQAVIDLQHISEVLRISLAEICVVPQMPNCVLGIYSWRGEMLWMVDIEEMLGYPPLLQGSNLLTKIMAIVLEKDGKYLGLLVRQLTDIEWMDTQQMKIPSPELFYPAMSPFLQGYFTNGSEQIIFNLDALAIIQSPMWGSHN
ncbi:purine-binding chemotaxis protein CheW [Anabaena aphanizomenioides LEGE 00250]|uniref:Purine-binding chemotaxis protein CheW n=1 Tax=Sphaerospermopsis aphanizomenoides LEGE 00250 TaxID=2777972 RepID=A0ABR9V7M0_9CYAN|nr:chemotaxis protein CheW [Sphaerospermopsis aphanizomenoides]MBE9234476.1 purine-binding chemotaxis protein CheW [Sphaerospermopsis aphanizomenoides LEGE 00250]